MIRSPRWIPWLACALAMFGCDRADSPATGGEPVRPVLGIDPATIETRTPLVARLLVFGLDGATWRLLDPLLEAGELPNLQGLVARGVSAEFVTLEPTLSPAIWTTIATGTLPAEHGILGFDGVPGQGMRSLPNATMRRRKTYWNVLSDFGVSTGTVGWWASWPADPLPDGSFLVSDRVPYTRMEAAIRRAGLEAGDVVPATLADEIAGLVEKPNEIDPNVVRRFLKMDEEEMRERLLDPDYRMGSFLPEFKFVYQSDRSTVRMAIAAARSHPVDVLSVYLTGLDTVSHLYWHFAFPQEFPRHRIPPEELEQFGDVIRLYYRQVDAWLGELLAALDAPTVLVVSDHGFGGTGQLPWSGGHGRITPGAPIAPRGVFILSGPGIAARPERMEPAHVLDVAPTILHLLGLPAARDMAGRTLASWTESGREPASRVESYEEIGRLRDAQSPTADAPGDADRLERLRALGYIQ